MSDVWERTTLGKVASNISETFRFSENEHVIFINTGDVYEGRFLHRKYSLAKTLPGQAKKRIRPNDILLTEIRPANKRYAFVDFPSDQYVVSTKFMIIRGNEKILPKYLYWILTNRATLREFQEIAESRSGTFPQITFDSISHLPIYLPSKEVQANILAIAEALAGKIALNQQMNETLEGIARALFKSWFIDFDPVRAKLDGRQPSGMDAETAALFPDSFEDSPLGKIPKGWEVGSLLEQAELISGGTPKTSNPEYWNGNIQWASAKDVSQCTDAFLIRTERKITSLGLEESSAKIIDAFSSVIVARGATTGRLAMFGSDIAMNQTCYALRSLLSCPFGLYCHLRFIIEDLVRTAHGSVFDTITTSTFKSSRVILPSKQVLMQFEEKIKPLFKRILINLEEVESIVHIRDSLLPKLLSGEICIKDAEQALEAVA